MAGGASSPWSRSLVSEQPASASPVELAPTGEEYSLEGEEEHLDQLIQEAPASAQLRQANEGRETGQANAVHRNQRGFLMCALPWSIL